MKRKALTNLIAAAMVMSLAACGSNAEAPVTTEEQPVVEEVKEEVKEETQEEIKEEAVATTEEQIEEASDKLSAEKRIEFEDFFESDGLGTEDSKDDDTLSLAGLNKSAYSAYEINLGDGGYNEIAVRYSSGTEGGKMEIHYMAPDGDLLGEIELPGTGDWANYTTVNADLSTLQSFGRDKVLYFVYSGDDYLFNLNWFQLYKSTDAGLQTEAENCFDYEGLCIEASSDEDGGDSLGGIKPGFWSAYKLNFGEGGFEQVSFRASSAMDNGGEIEIRLGAVDGDLLGTAKIDYTGDWSMWETFTADVPALKDITGMQDIYLVYTNGGDYLFNLNWLRFYKAPLSLAGRVEAEDFIEASVIAEPCGAENDGTMNIGGVTPGTYAAYALNFGEGGYAKLKVRASSPMSGGDIIMHEASLTGEVLATVTIGNSEVYGGDWGNYGDWEFEVPELKDVTGSHVVYFEFNNSPENSSHLFNINWYEFTK